MSDGLVKKQWWPLALAAEISAKRVTAVSCGAHEIALFRDHHGTPYGFEDRCPHRRMPLSLGRITPEGWVQCGYHGWCFEGKKGACTAIPNFGAEEKVPDRYGANVYPVRESHGFIFVWVDDDRLNRKCPPDEQNIPKLELPALAIKSNRRQLRGCEMVTLLHNDFITAFLDRPSLLLKLLGIRITDFIVGGPEIVDGYLRVEHGAAWNTLGMLDRFSADFPLIFRSTTAAVTGLSAIEIVNAADGIILQVIIAPAPAGRGVTAVRWICQIADNVMTAKFGLWSAGRLLGAMPLSVRSHIDAAALAKLKPGPSLEWPALNRNTVVSPLTI